MLSQTFHGTNVGMVQNSRFYVSFCNIISDFLRNPYCQDSKKNVNMCFNFNIISNFHEFSVAKIRKISLDMLFF